MDESTPSRTSRTFNTYQIALLVLLVLLAGTSWLFAVWAAYVKVPNTRRLVADFKKEIDPASRAALEWGGLVLPALACVGLIVVWWTRSRWAWRFVLLVLPLLAGTALYFISDHVVGKLQEALGG